MEITSPVQPAPATSPAAAPPTQAASTLSSDFETFLKMLTTQLQNQDPLNPVDSSDFAVQLATFSSVEQQVLTNDLLTSLGDQIGSLGVAQLSGWVGMTARAKVPVAFDGAPVTLNIHTAAGADSAQLVVRSALGAEILRSPVPPVSGEIEWAGVDANGAPLPPGTYALSVESFRNNELTETHAVEVQGRIVEARSENGLTILVLEGGQELAARDILGLREPGA